MSCLEVNQWNPYGGDIDPHVASQKSSKKMKMEILLRPARLTCSHEKQRQHTALHLHAPRATSPAQPLRPRRRRPPCQAPRSRARTHSAHDNAPCGAPRKPARALHWPASTSLRVTSLKASRYCVSVGRPSSTSVLHTEEQLQRFPNRTERRAAELRHIACRANKQKCFTAIEAKDRDLKCS
eukprot:3957909-Pleurochrysis_carterae.AAC.2